MPKIKFGNQYDQSQSKTSIITGAKSELEVEFGNQYHQSDRIVDIRDAGVSTRLLRDLVEIEKTLSANQTNTQDMRDTIEYIRHCLEQQQISAPPKKAHKYLNKILDKSIDLGFDTFTSFLKHIVTLLVI